MKQFSPLQLQILDCLADGACHSGNEIGDQPGVSRTAVWKHVRQLIEMGLDIQRLPNKGYQLAKPFRPVRETELRRLLDKTPMTQDPAFHLFAETDSTNRYLRDEAGSGAVHVCHAEKQTAGRGRFGRQWTSPFGDNICLSTRWKLNCCPSKLSGLSLVVGLAILESLKPHIRETIRIKWPNDLLWNDKKLCGILIELTAESNGFSDVIIGIGLNVNTDTKSRPLPDKPWCSLYELTGIYHDRNVLIASLLPVLERYLDQFLASGFGGFHPYWQQVDYLEGQLVHVSQARGSLCGRACGVTVQGNLLLMDEHGEEHQLSSGDTSLHVGD